MTDQVTRMTVIPKPLKCVHCGQPILRTEGIIWLNNGEEARHERECKQWRPAGPVSDGALQCPETHGELRCQKRIPRGWHENEGHGGGHWFEPEAHRDRMRNAHVDAAALLSLQPAATHDAQDCPAGPGEPCPLTGQVNR